MIFFKLSVKIILRLIINDTNTVAGYSPTGEFTICSLTSSRKYEFIFKMATKMSPMCSFKKISEKNNKTHK